MLSERIQTQVMRALSSDCLEKEPVKSESSNLPAAKDATEPCLLYIHIPFCERLCPYCSFCRYPFSEARARAYFAALRKEMQMAASLGYAAESLYIGGGTPTILIDELARTIDEARRLFNIQEVSCETNPNHLTPELVDVLDGRVQRLSVGVQSFDDELLKRMQRYEKYGSGMDILERLQTFKGRFKSLNADMMFNFPTQTEEVLIRDLAAVLESGVSQVTFYPLMASPSVEQSLAASVGRVDYKREAHYYALISEALVGKSKDTPMSSTAFAQKAPFEFGSAWTFNASDAKMIDEYIINYDEYPALGAGGFSYLGGKLYANTFSVDEYIKQIEAGGMSVKQTNSFSWINKMRYRFMMQLFGLRLDKREWKRLFGMSVVASLPAEYAFFKAVGAFATDNEQEITLSAKGRYLLVAMMREFFVGVNGLRDSARLALPPNERELLFS